MWALGFLIQSFTQVRMRIYYPFSSTLFDCHSQLFTHTPCETKLKIVANVISLIQVGITLFPHLHCKLVIIMSPEDLETLVSFFPATALKWNQIHKSRTVCHFHQNTELFKYRNKQTCNESTLSQENQSRVISVLVVKDADHVVKLA